MNDIDLFGHLEAEPKCDLDLEEFTTTTLTNGLTKEGEEEGGKVTETDEVAIDPKKIFEQSISLTEMFNQMTSDAMRRMYESLPQLYMKEIHRSTECTHSVSLLPEIEYEDLEEIDKMIIKFPFKLDTFQMEAVKCVHNIQSVLVAAHTSAGKTVVALYAVALALKSKQKVIYTSPVKALSNQKYQDLLTEFNDVGLMTGDITINPDASCLVMTTEILRSMLYRGSEIIREVAWIVFDEIHYMRDSERGVVWEESIILLPDNVHFVFLSATIPNGDQFVQWITFLHHQPCHIVSTEYRPVPLEHFIYPVSNNNVYQVVDKEGTFKQETFDQAMDSLTTSTPVKKHHTVAFDLVKLAENHNLLPTIVFSFSKKECESYMLELSPCNYNSSDESKSVERVFNSAISSLSEEDQKLSRIINLLPTLRRGIGVHHGGLLPIMKEVTEILFAEGLIKVLHATETFALGMNMPARTVIFTSPTKFDGKETRYLNSGEYIQMSGRAGRRGLDDKGLVILAIDKKITPATCKDIVKGEAKPLNSAFRLTYNMVLNLLRVEGINPEFMLERSFYQFQNFATIPKLRDSMKTLVKKLYSVKVQQMEEVSSYYNLRKRLHELNSQLLTYICDPKIITPFLHPGRVIHIKTMTHDFNWGILLNVRQKKNTELGEKDCYLLDMLLNVKPISNNERDIVHLRPAPNYRTGEMKVVPVHLSIVYQISSIRLYLPEELQSKDSRQSLGSVLNELCSIKYPDGLPLMDPIEDMHIEDEEFKKLIYDIKRYETKLYGHSLYQANNLDELLNKYEAKLRIENELQDMKNALKNAHSILHQDLLKKMKRVLRRLDYCAEGDVISMKGRVACEIDTGDELVLTEMLLDGVFNNLTASESCALLSCFVCDEKSNDQIKLGEKLKEGTKCLRDTARHVAQVFTESKITINEHSYLDKFKDNLMVVTSDWIEGKSFAEILKSCNIFEGSIIRCLRRLEEVLRQVICAAKTIGNEELIVKFEEAIAKLKRDLIFANSLYI
ncbi:hypothetical protein SNEBB_009246 [Seison nebaliae]|nr:hypothetical protein SNEBB_009246 [Seison nebaliae]